MVDDVNMWYSKAVILWYDETKNTSNELFYLVDITFLLLSSVAVHGVNAKTDFVSESRPKS